MTKNTVWHLVKQSDLHGQGVFAAKNIPEGTFILEYLGKRISAEAADEKAAHADDPSHTFFFSLSSGQIIDGGEQGNDARWINHCCEPNCEAQEDDDGNNVYIVSLRDIKKGEELYFDYGLLIDDVITDELKNQYKCLCGSDNCRGTMLANLTPEHISELDQPAFIEQFAQIFNQSPWVAERTWLFKPFATTGDLYTCMVDVVLEASKKEQAQLISAYPELTGLKLKTQLDKIAEIAHDRLHELMNHTK